MNYISGNNSYPLRAMAAYLLAFALLICALSKITALRHTEAMQQSIAHEVIRLHVLANSDSEEDQQLKLTVKDAIVAYMQEELQDVTSIADARMQILSLSDSINEIAKKTIAAEGYSYSVTTSLGTSYFPEKTYGDLTFPAGEYEALQVRIGKSQGHNWWCVLFPTLCFVDETSAVVPEDSKEILKESLTVEEYNSLLMDEDVDVTYRFALWDMLSGILSDCTFCDYKLY